MTTMIAVDRETKLAEKGAAAKLAAARAESALGNLRATVLEVEGEFKALTAELGKYGPIDADEALAFLKEPWCVLPKGRDQWWVVIPRFVGVQVGWLERATETYNVFVVNRYAHWLGGVPPALADILKLPAPFESQVEGRTLRTSAKLPAGAKPHIAQQVGPAEYRIKVGHEFDLIAALIEAGSLPFVPRPVDPVDLRQVTLRGPLAKLRDYESAAWDEFLKRGAVGIFWPWGTGKTVFGGHAIARLNGPKLVVCPSTTLVEHWQKKLGEWLDLSLRHDVDIVTYNAWNRVKDKRYVLAVFDEAHRLPASTFSRLATVPAKYRIGLSATPQREDGRTNYIFALTGWPLGTDWVEFIRRGYITKPHIEVRIVAGWNEKMRETQREAEETKGGSTLVFCDSIARGAQLAGRLKCPHVHGKTDRRLETLEKARVAVVSRVGDEGVSLPGLRKVVEVDFLGSSRRQEGQRVGRLMHADKPGEHVVLMTQEEFTKFEGRFLALEEKGFKVNVRTR